MSAASYMGLPVSLATTSGSKLTGTIISLDQQDATLTIRTEQGQLTTFKRSDIASLDIIQATTPGATLRPTADAAPAAQQQRPKTPPSRPAAAATEQPAQSALSKSARKRLAAKEREAAALGSSSSSGPSSSPMPAHALAVPSHAAAAGSAGKKKGKQSAAALTASSSGNEYDEDFDFDAALKTFDKQAIWKEIQANDTSDPMARLHAHNRAKPNGTSSSSSGGAAALGRTPSPGSYGRGAGRNAYQKLRNDENVLSPEPESPTQPSSEASRTPAPVSVPAAATNGSSDEVAALRAQLEVLSALAGLDIKSSASPSGAEEFLVTLYSTPAQRTAAQRAASSNSAPAAGALTFALSTSGGGVKKLRYLGAKEELSDKAMLEKVPQSYRGEMGIGGERAAAFVGRLKSCIEGKET